MGVGIQRPLTGWLTADGGGLHEPTAIDLVLRYFAATTCRLIVATITVQVLAAK